MSAHLARSEGRLEWMRASSRCFVRILVAGRQGTRERRDLLDASAETNEHKQVVQKWCRGETLKSPISLGISCGRPLKSSRPQGCIKVIVPSRQAVIVPSPQVLKPCQAHRLESSSCVKFKSDLGAGACECLRTLRHRHQFAIGLEVPSCGMLALAVMPRTLPPVMSFISTNTGALEWTARSCSLASTPPLYAVIADESTQCLPALDTRPPFTVAHHATGRLVKRTTA
ncbi:hypothetical protein GGX14DRAFT_389311 [Mycena pura]|uniref:Uncharacterized protein n=1 Tax=Mycena pura TaxID=153505 RepID=A0AAD6VUZ7_9AGAR|nr:hypothetical protein GGX14DRAFT_389311 [Mycena pura]